MAVETPLRSGADEASGRLIVVSNRLPMTIKRKKQAPFQQQQQPTSSSTESNSGGGDGVPEATSPTEEAGYDYSMSSGGLVSALSGLKKMKAFTWIGWPGLEFSEKEQQIVAEDVKRDYNCAPVFLSDAVAELYYNGFSNSILWPLFHYLAGDINFDAQTWDGYIQANQAFADAVIDTVQEGDLVWVQDYHLMLLPKMLRTAVDARGIANVRIGYFLHTPFPSSEVYRILPVRREILEGVLSSDLVGFHTFDYARHFLSSCQTILGAETTSNGLWYNQRFVRVGTYPIGIDPEKFEHGLQQPSIINKIATLRRKHADMQIIVGVDRLDYIKGVPQKLHAFDTFLSRYPEYAGKVMLVQVAVPSRTDVEEYQQLRSTCNELVGEINGKHGTMDFMPIHYLNKSVDFEHLTALYTVADVCLITSCRDGMNLVSYEYICCQKENHGVLILSEFAGAAQSLNGSIIVNPWNTDEVAEAIYEAVSMSAEARQKNHEYLYRYVTKYTAAYWGVTFVEDMRAMSMPSKHRPANTAATTAATTAVH